MFRILFCTGVFIVDLVHGFGFFPSLLWAIIWYVLLTAVLFLIGLAMMLLAGTGYGVYAIWCKITGKSIE